MVKDCTTCIHDRTCNIDRTCIYSDFKYYSAIRNVEDKETSDGSTANYYQLPDNSSQLQDLISFRNMNGQAAEIFRACYRYGQVSHSPKLRDMKKIKFYAEAEIERLEKYEHHAQTNATSS